MTSIEIKFYARVIIFSTFYQVLGVKIRKAAFFLCVCVNFLTVLFVNKVDVSLKVIPSLETLILDDNLIQVMEECYTILYM